MPPTQAILDDIVARTRTRLALAGCECPDVSALVEHAKGERDQITVRVIHLDECRLSPDYHQVASE